MAQSSLLKMSTFGYIKNLLNNQRFPSQITSLLDISWRMNDGILVVNQNWNAVDANQRISCVVLVKPFFWVNVYSNFVSLSFLFVVACVLDVNQFSQEFPISELAFWIIHFSLGFTCLSLRLLFNFLVFQRFTRKLSVHILLLRMRNFTWNRFPLQNFVIDSLME